MMGNDGYFRATSKSCSARWRCCHNGARFPGLRLGSSNARAAHSRNREAKSAEPPTCSVTISSISSGSKAKIDASGSASPSGRRNTIPSSPATAWASMPVRSAMRAPIASAHGALTPRPNGECNTMRQSPSSSLNRSITNVESSGIEPVASYCSCKKARRLSFAHASVWLISSGFACASRRNAPIAWPNSYGLPAASPDQNGKRPVCPGAGVTITWSRVMSSIRHEDAPRVNTSPTRDS